MDEIDNLIRMSKYGGEREDLVQAGGGNSSVKLSKYEMAIKSSGIQMANVRHDAGYTVVNYQYILDALNDAKYSESVISQKCIVNGNNPSIETFLHSMTSKYTLHTHPVVVNAITSRKNWNEELLNLFPDAILVPYVKPGLELAVALKEQIKQTGKCPNIVFLQNHGLLVSNKDVDNVIKKTDEIIKKIYEYLGLPINDIVNASVLRETVKDISELNDYIVYKCNDHDILQYMDSKYETMGMEIGFCPDCIVYAGIKACIVDGNIKRQLMKHMNSYGIPVVIIYKKTVYICAETIRKAKEIESLISFGVKVKTINKNYPMNYLSDEEKMKLVNWDVEKYRRGL